MTGLSDLLARQRFVVLDGGFATELEALGADLRHPLWSAKVLLDSPDLVMRVNDAYLRAGADVALTASYQASLPGLLACGLTASQAEAVLRGSVELARQARDRFWSDPAVRVGRHQPLVVASIGPYGAYLHDGSEYRGNYGLSRDELKDFHRSRLGMLIRAQPDLLAFESFPSQLEAEAVVELLAEFPDAACWISFTCRDELHISEGTVFADAVRAVTRSPQVLAAGVNCVPPRLVSPLLQSANNATDKPLVAYPNSGAWDESSQPERIDDGRIDDAVNTWYDAGARLIGGCCRTTPKTIESIRAKLTGSS